MEYPVHLDPKRLSFATIFLLSNRLQKVMDTQMKDLTAKQWLVLAVLEAFSEAPSLKALSIACASSHQNIKQLVLKLEQKGFVMIQRDEWDRRTLRIQRTKKCGEWVKENQAFQEAFLESMFYGISEQEVDVFQKLQLRLCKNLEQMEEEE